MSEFEIWNELGNIYYKSGAYIQAIRTCQKMIALDPDCSLPYINLAAIFVCQGRFTEAIPMYKQGIELLDGTVNQAHLWKRLGDAYRKLEDYGNASASYRRAVELDPQDATIQEYLTEVELASRIPDSKSLDEVNQNDLPSPKLDFLEGSAPGIEESQNSSPGKACWVFKENESPSKVGKENSDVSEQFPLILGSRILSEVDKEKDNTEIPDPLEEALVTDQVISEISNNTSSSEIEDTRTLDPADGLLPINPPVVVESFDPGAHGLLRLGILHLRKGEYERASRFLKIALCTADRFHNHFLEALCHYGIAQVETGLGKIEPAIQSYQSAANLAPERIFPCNALGSLNCMLDRYEDALAAFQEAIEHDPKDPVSWNGLGDVYHKLGRKEDAIAAYQLGNVFEKQGIDEDILKEFEKTIDPDQENPHFWNEAGNIYYDTGAYDDAIGCYRKAIDLDLTNATFQTCLAKAEQALAETNARGEAPTRQTLNKINPGVLPKVESIPSQTASPQAEKINAPQLDSACSKPVQDAEQVREKLSDPIDNAADSEPETAYWMFKTDHQPGSAQQPATCNLPAYTKTVVRTIEPAPVFALKMHQKQSFSIDQVLQNDDLDHASILVQLTPHTSKPAETIETSRISAEKQNRESASTVVDSEALKSCSDSGEIRAKDSAHHAHETGIQVTGQPLPDPQIHENDIAAYRRVTEINPNNDRAWDALGNAYEAVGLHDEAIEAFERAIALYPQRETYHYHLGIALGYLKQYDRAIQVLLKVVALNPNYILAHCALAGFYRRFGRETEAQEHMKIARPSMENENDYNQACFESISGDADRAIDLLEIALEKKQIQPEMVRSDPDLDFIRKDPRFEALLDKYRIVNQ